MFTRVPKGLTSRRGLTRSAGALGGNILPISKKIFDTFNVMSDKYSDSVGRFFPESDHDYRNKHLVGDGATAIYFYPELDGEGVHFYNVDTLTWIDQVYVHATGVIFGAGVNILEAYSDLGDVWTFEEDGCNHVLYNLKCECHGSIDAAGVILEAFRAGRNDLVSQWGTAIRGLNNHAYGYSTALAASGAVILTRFTEPTPLAFDISLTYNAVVSPIIYDYGNTLIDGTGDGYGMRVNSDFTLDFFRKDAGVIVVLATTTQTYPNGCRVEMIYSLPNDQFKLKAYQLGAVNPSDIDNVSDPTYPYPENDYQRLELPNGDETVSLATDGVSEDLNLWTVTGTVCQFFIPAAFTLSDDAIPVITGFIYDEAGHRLNADGGLLEYVGMIKFNAGMVNSNAFQGNGIDNSVDTLQVPVDSADWYWKSFGRFITLGSNRIGATQFYFGVEGAGYRFGYKDYNSVNLGVSDTEFHEFKLTGDGKFYVDDNLLDESIGAVGIFTLAIYLLDRNGSSAPADFEQIYSEIGNSDGVIQKIVASAGIGDQLYDTDGAEYPVIGTINEETQWVEQDEYHYNMTEGFDMYENTTKDRLLVPIGSTVTQAGYAFNKSFPQDGKSILPCETKFSMPQAPILIQADVDNVLFDVSGVPIPLGYDEIINATASQTVIGIESTVGTDGQAQAEIRGLTVHNSNENDDIQTLDGYSAFASSNSLANQILTNITDGSQASGQVLKNTTLLNANGYDIFIKARARVTNSNCLVLRLDVDGTGGVQEAIGIVINNPVQNQWYYFYEKISPTTFNNGLLRLIFTHNYADGATANGKIMEIDGVEKVQSIKTSDTSFSAWAESKLLLLAQSMQAGTDLQDVKNPILRSNGKNLFDYNNLGTHVLGNLTVFEEGLKGESSDNWDEATYGIEELGLKETYSYQFKAYQKIVVGDDRRVTILFFGDDGITLLDFVDTDQIGTGYVSVVSTIPIGTRYVEFRFARNTATAHEVNYLEIQLELGTVATTYEAYKLSEMSILASGGADWYGRSLPNSVYDYIDVFGRSHQNVQEYVLQSSDVASLVTALANVDLVVVNKQLDDYLYDNDTLSLENSKRYNIPGFTPIPALFDDVSSEYTNYNRGTTTIALLVPKSVYASLAEAQADLAGTVILYQLATPIIIDAQITIVDQDGNPQAYWHLYEGGVIEGEAELLLPIGVYENLQHGTQIFADTSRWDQGKKQRLVGYSEEQTGYSLDRIYQALNK